MHGEPNKHSCLICASLEILSLLPQDYASKILVQQKLKSAINSGRSVCLQVWGTGTEEDTKNL